MSFISYAQNYEDVILWRSLKHVINGFYIDVGAAWPEEHSVTKAFYDAGWSGINIEPNPSFINLYHTQRPKDINIQAALSDSLGVVPLHLIDKTGLSSLDKRITDTHAVQGYLAEDVAVEVTTLAVICGQYVENRDIHFLKIDVEGFERNVLLGNDWQVYRPWVVLVEATLPLQKIENYGTWEPILLDADYLFAYADGLNRFYIAKEHEYLLDAFKYPPNVFDDFVLHQEAVSQQIIVQLEEKVNFIQEKLLGLEQHQQAMMLSLSWRITYPLRFIWKVAQWLFHRSVIPLTRVLRRWYSEY